MDKFKALYTRKKSKVRELTQKIFLKLLFKIFPKNYLSYKKLFAAVLHKIRVGPYFFLKVMFLRFKYPSYFYLPTKHLYAIHLLIKFSNLFKLHDINFFLVGGTLLGAIRQGSFAGRPTDVDIGILEKDCPKLLKVIPLLEKKFSAVSIRSEPYDKFERLQLRFNLLIFDIGIYKKKVINEEEFWVNNQDQNYDYLAADKKMKNNSLKKINIFHKKDLEHLFQVKLYGKPFLAPSNPESYLKQKYGENWKIPNRKQFYWRKIK